MSPSVEMYGFDSTRPAGDHPSLIGDNYGGNCNLGRTIQ